MLEQIAMNDRYKFWLDEASQLFGGMDVCALQLIVEQETGKEFIIDMCDSAFNLLGEQQDVDRRMMADLVYEKMAKIYTNLNLTESKGTPTPPNALNATRAKIQSQHSINKEDDLLFNTSHKNSTFNSNQSIKDASNSQLPNSSLPSQAGNLVTSVSQSSSVSLNPTRFTGATQPPQHPESSKTPSKVAAGPPTQPQAPASAQVPPPIPSHQSKIVPTNQNDEKLKEQEDMGKVNAQTTRGLPTQQAVPSKPNMPPSRMNTLPSIPNTNVKTGPIMTTSSSTIGQSPPAVPNRPVSNATSATNKPLSTTGALFSAAKSSEGKSSDEPEDTMNNLRKTFAGIFGNSSLI
jgi:hypothetical protein